MLRKGTESILIVDDEEILRITAKIILEKCGYTVNVASNGDEALAAIEKNSGSIDLILLDFVMPGLSGEKLIGKIKELNGTFKILLASGLNDCQQIINTLGDANYGFIQKPFTLEKLSIAVGELLNQTE